MRERPLKRAAFGALRWLGVTAVSTALARGVPILTYHGVTDGPADGAWNRGRLHLSRARFETHLELLRRRWWPVSLSALVSATLAGTRLPPRSVVVTFDDGYRNVLTTALPLLVQYRIPATVFVVTGPDPFASYGSAPPARLEADGARRAAASLATRAPAADRALLSWDDVRTLNRAGVEIGSHADVHIPLTSRPLADVQAALARSHATLTRELGRGSYALAYPLGAWSRPVAAAAREAGFSCALTTDAGLNRPDTPLLALRRFLIDADTDAQRLRTSLSGLRACWLRQTMEVGGPDLAPAPDARSVPAKPGRSSILRRGKRGAGPSR